MSGYFRLDLVRCEYFSFVMLCQVRTCYIRIGQDKSCYMLSQVRTG
jgi:hypothetical protein